MSPESENHYPLSLKRLDEDAVLKQCIDFPPRTHARTHTLFSPSRARAACSAPPPPRAPKSGGGGGGGPSVWVFARVCSPPCGCRCAGAGRRCAAAPPPAGRRCGLPGASPAPAPPLPARCTATRSVVNIWGWGRADLTRVSLSLGFFGGFFFVVVAFFFLRNSFKAKVIQLFPRLKFPAFL